MAKECKKHKFTPTATYWVNEQRFLEVVCFEEDGECEESKIIEGKEINF